MCLVFFQVICGDTSGTIHHHKSQGPQIVLTSLGRPKTWYKERPHRSPLEQWKAAFFHNISVKHMMVFESHGVESERQSRSLLVQLTAHGVQKREASLASWRSRLADAFDLKGVDAIVIDGAMKASTYGTKLLPPFRG